MGTVNEDMNDSIVILRKAEPVIKQLLQINDGEVIDVENQDNEACRHLDIFCGIDYLLHLKEYGLTRGAAWRAQKEHPVLGPYNSFTIRKTRDSGTKTEYAKRKYAIDNNGLYPYYTIQAFYGSKTKDLLSLAIARTTDILDCIAKGIYDENHTGKYQNGQADYYVIWWNAMKKNGYQILEWKR